MLNHGTEKVKVSLFISRLRQTDVMLTWYYYWYY